ncbi:MAG: DUF1540 domain-containing protein [Clostridia bacterium]|nr:DUF1540 domain-containing protein [Clostridia bacterium]MBR6755310.1 DUF1540 domain-containing protein [Clostridia bacterium]
MNQISFNQIPKHIHGISCSVTNCAYHDGIHYCTANKITVGPSTATNSSQTVCATFRHKEF